MDVESEDPVPAMCPGVLLAEPVDGAADDAGGGVETARVPGDG
jgi:hypothetical protein